MDMLSGYILSSERDRKLWELDKNGDFFYYKVSILCHYELESDIFIFTWKPLPKVLEFMWAASLNGVFTINNLWHHKKILNSVC